MPGLSVLAALLATVLLSISNIVEATVHAAVVFARTGERNPLLVPASYGYHNEAIYSLTSTGAQQVYALGDSFRNRWIANNGSSNDTFIENLNTNQPNPDEVEITVPDSGYLQASAQSFMQAFLPPEAVNVSEVLDISEQLSNSQVVSYPLDGYKYPMISTLSIRDPESIYVDGRANCSSFGLSRYAYFQSEDFITTLNSTAGLYQRIGADVLNPLFVDPEYEWSYADAYLVYDCLRFQYVHNTAVLDMFNDPESQDMMRQLRWLADKLEWQLNGDSEGQTGIRTVAGRTLAARILGALQRNVETRGRSNKVSITFGEHHPMLSLFSLLNLPNINSNFYGLPNFGSALVFELFSVDREDDGNDAVAPEDAYPAEEDLWVRFYFRNGSDFDPGLPGGPLDLGSEYRAYPIFGRGPDRTSLRWVEFQTEMSQIMLNDVGEWCTACNAYSTVFCPYFMDTTWVWSGSGGSSSSRSGAMTLHVAGVIGAAVTLGVLLIALLAALLFGVRFRKQQSAWSKKPQDGGGFKGSAKLASDQDLTLSTSGAPMGNRASEATTVVGDVKGHERVGSWELQQPSSPSSPSSTFGGFGSLAKDIEVGQSLNDRPEEVRRSYDEGDDIGFAKPVRPRESI